MLLYSLKFAINTITREVKVLGILTLRIFHPKSPFGAHFTQINFRIKVCCKRIAVVSSVTIQNINALYCVKIMLLRVCTKDIRNTRVKAATKQSKDSSFLVARVIRPLLLIFKMRGIGVFIVCGVQIMRLCAQTRLHNRQILIRKRDIHHELWAIFFNQSHKGFHIVRIYCIHLNFTQAFGANRICDCLAFAQCA